MRDAHRHADGHHLAGGVRLHLGRVIRVLQPLAEEEVAFRGVVVGGAGRQLGELLHVRCVVLLDRRRDGLPAGAGVGRSEGARCRGCDDAVGEDGGGEEEEERGGEC